MKRLFAVLLLLGLFTLGISVLAEEEEANFPMGWDIHSHSDLYSYQTSFPKSVMTGNEILIFRNTYAFTSATGKDYGMTALMPIPWTWVGSSVDYDW